VLADALAKPPARLTEEQEPLSLWKDHGADLRRRASELPR
jgi:hypothetical protein